MAPQYLFLALLAAQGPDDPTALINTELPLRWRAEKLTPADKCSDHEFLRRATLDLIGRIPTLAEQEAFLKDDARQRRRLLVDRLLAHDDYARHWADLWSDWLMGPTTDAKAWQPFHDWLQLHFAKNGSHKQFVEKLLLARGSPRDNPAVHFYVRHRGMPVPEKEWDKWGQYDMAPFTGHVFRVLHAKRLQCVQCHDHPFDGDIHQNDFHQMNLFFRQVRFTQKKDAVVEVSDDPQLNKSGLMNYERRNGILLFTAPRFYKGDTWKPGMKQTRREFFVDRFVKHPDFAYGHVNFLWTYLFGHGLTQTTEFDDMAGDNTVVHAKIMERLATEFVKSGHDSKAILRWICNSDAYALGSVANKTNASADQARFHARMQARPLTRRQLAESVAVALTGEDYLKRRDALRAELLAELPPLAIPAVSHCEAEPLYMGGKLSVQQALWLMNGSVLQREIASPQGPIAKAIKKHGASAEGIKKAVPELFAITLCRPPTAQEMQRLTDPKLVNWRAQPGQQATPAHWRTLYEDIFWALLNSSEFALNH